MISNLRVKFTSWVWQGLLLRARWVSVALVTVSEARWSAPRCSRIIFYTRVFHVFLNKSELTAKDHEDSSKKEYKWPIKA